MTALKSDPTNSKKHLNISTADNS